MFLSDLMSIAALLSSAAMVEVNQENVVRGDKPEAAAAIAVAERAEVPSTENEALLKEQFNGLSDQELLTKIIAGIEDTTTMTSDFTQVAPSGAVATGKLYLRRPGRARFEYDAPSPILIVANQGNVYVEDSELEQTDSYPIKQTPLKYLLNKNIDLEGVTVVGSERFEDTVALTVRSNDDETEGELTLVASLPEYKLQAWSILDSQNGVTIVELSNQEYGGKIPNNRFKVPEAGGAFINN